MNHSHFEDAESRLLLKVAKYTMVCTLLAAGIVASVYLFAFWGRPIDSQTDGWGQLGDYFGGVMNPIVGIATVVLVFVTVRIQTRELRSSLEELRQSNLVLEAQLKSTAKQNFEQTLFAWLSNYRDLLDSVVIHGDNATYTGRRALHSMYLGHIAPKRLLAIEKFSGVRYLLAHSHATGEAIGAVKLLEIDQITRDDLIELAEKRFDKLYSENEFQLDSLFRTLFRIFRWIDKHEEISEEQKWFYCALVRAQLSWTELVFLFYNGITERGAPFASVANRYAIFDNLTLHSDIVLFIVKLRMCDSGRYTAAAFDSDEARRRLE